MRNAIAALALWGAGCAGPTAKPEVLTISIVAAPMPSLVAFQDGIDEAWQPATMITPTSFAATVHGPYVVTIVCEFQGSAYVTQLARTLDDDPC